MITKTQLREREMIPYTKYKDSGIKWIGEIPETWVNRKIARSFNLIGSGTTPKADNMAFYSNGDINWVLTGDLKDNTIKVANKKITTEAFEKHSALKMFPPGTLLIAMYGATIGKVGILDIEACTNQACCALAESELINNRFLYYWFIANRKQIINLSYGGGQPNISQEIVKTLIVPSPEILEQKAIVSFLDKKTSDIDNTIIKKEKLLELLEEERKTLINEAVTKGLNPDVQMISSDMDWIDEMPEHWEVKKLKNITSLLTNGYVGPTKDILVDKGVRYIQSLHVKQHQLLFNHPYYVSEEWSEAHPRSILKENDVLIVQTGAGTGNIGIVTKEFEGCNCHALIILRADNYKCNGKYLLKALLANYGYHKLKSIETGALHPHLNSTIVKEVKILVPPIQEQIAISDYIDNNNSKFDNTKRKIQQEIELLKEYKQALIFEAVTGKIDVREEGKVI